MSDKVKKQYDEVIDDYSGTFKTLAGEYYINRKMDTFRKYLPPPKPGLKMLEVGSADGVFTERFVNLGYEVVGVDFSKTQLARAKKRNPNTKFIEADGQNMPFEANTFDCIVSMCTVRYFEHPDKGMAEFFRCLKPGGTVVIDVPNKYSPFFWGLGDIFNMIFRLPKPAYTVTFTKGAIEKLFQETGFSSVRTEHILLTYRYFPDWLLRISGAAENIAEKTIALRWMLALIVCAGKKPGGRP